MCRIAANLRSTADEDASYSVGEAVGVKTGHVIIHDLHFTTLVVAHLVQADLVFLRVLSGNG